MRAIITGQNTFCSCAADDDDLVIGGEYELIPVENKTQKQNSTFHALIRAYWQSNCHSYNVKNYKKFREYIKRDFGIVEPYYRITGTDGKPCEPRIDYRNKSVKYYTKKELTESIDRLLAEMEQAQVDTRYDNEIRRGMEENSMRRLVEAAW
jgi:hypothetical protein